MKGINCGPKKERINTSCTPKCKHYAACCEELNINPPRYKFKEVRPNTLEIVMGACHLDHNGEIKTWRLIPIK